MGSTGTSSQPSSSQPSVPSATIGNTKENERAILVALGQAFKILGEICLHLGTGGTASDFGQPRCAGDGLALFRDQPSSVQFVKARAGRAEHIDERGWFFQEFFQLLRGDSCAAGNRVGGRCPISPDAQSVLRMKEVKKHASRISIHPRRA